MKLSGALLASVLATWAVATPLATPATLCSDSINVNGVDDGPPPLCLRICVGQDITCPSGWDVTKLGDCYTCCRKRDVITDQRLAHSNGDKASKSISVNNYDNGSGLCMLVCVPRKLECPANWHAQLFGEDCWTCCKDENPPVIAKAVSHKVTKPELAHVNDGALCWRACFPEERDCPPPGKPFEHGQCWTCCFEGDGNAAVEKSHLVGQSHLGL